MTLIKRLLALFQSCPPYRHHCEHLSPERPYKPESCQNQNREFGLNGRTCREITCCRCGATRLAIYTPLSLRQ